MSPPKFVHWKVLAIVLLGLARYSFGATSLQSPPNSSDVSVELGKDKAAPGEWVVLPLSLRIRESIPLEAVGVDIPFPVASLSFEVVRPTLIPEEAEVQFSLEPSNSDATEQTLRLTVKGKGKSLPTGLVARIVFKIFEGALPGTRVVLPVHVTSADSNTTVRSQSLQLSGGQGEVEISGGVGFIFGCFFYMH